MAGIGIEFKRFVHKRTFFSTLRGIGFSMITTLMPILMVVLVLMGMYEALGYDAVRYALREQLSASILYAFVFPLIISSAFGTPLSRYISNMVYKKDYAEVGAAFYTGLLLALGAAALLGLPFYIRLYVLGKVEPLFVLVSYLLYMSVSLSFYTTVFLSVVRDFKHMALFYVIGLSAAFLLSLLFVYALRLEVTFSILLSLTVGFLLISALEYGFAGSFFPENSHNYGAVLPFFKKWKELVLANLCYSLGLFVHNFVFWSSGLGVSVAGGSYAYAPLYDMASCLGLYVNVIATVIFTVQVESKFVDKYKEYCETVISGRLLDIERAKRRMLRTRSEVSLSSAELQFISTVGMFLLFMFVLPRFGIYGLTLSIFPGLAAAYFAVYIMYAQMTFLYYFEDDRGALLVGVSFFLCTLGFSILARSFFAMPWYGVGLFAGACVAWLIGYFRLRWVEKGLDAHIFCTGSLINTVRRPMPTNRVYTGAAPQTQQQTHEKEKAYSTV